MRNVARHQQRRLGDGLVDLKISNLVYLKTSVVSLNEKLNVPSKNYLAFILSLMPYLHVQVDQAEVLVIGHGRHEGVGGQRVRQSGGTLN